MPEGHIVSALDGQFGAYHSTCRTSGNTLWINPLMAFYWCFNLDAVAERVLYLNEIRQTESYEDVMYAIEAFRGNLTDKRLWDDIPI